MRDNSSDSSGSPKFRQRRPKNLSLWRPRSLISLLPTTSNGNDYPVLVSSPSTDSIDTVSSVSYDYKDRGNNDWDTVVTIILVEAKDLPDPMNDDCSHTLYCKIRLGTEGYRSKLVQSSKRPQWRERFELHLRGDHFLRVSLWDKGKQKNFMGSCVINLMDLKKERSHEIWTQLDDGFGLIHFNITMCTINPTSVTIEDKTDTKRLAEKFDLFNLGSDWKIVGQLYVKVIGAKGLPGKPNVYCLLQLDNDRVQTPIVKGTSQPVWNKEYVFNVYDVTSTLNIKLCENSLMNSLMLEYFGRVSIPLLRITNGEVRWHALKDKNFRNNAKGNCPRILLEMSLFYNPVKASLRVFRPKGTQYIKKQPKMDLTLIHNNVLHIRDLMIGLKILNEHIKQFLEWENRKLSTVVLIGWLIFWYNFETWFAPLILLAPFLYIWINKETHQAKLLLRGHDRIVDESESKEKFEMSLTSRLFDTPETVAVIIESTDFISSTIEKLYNLLTFKVPFLTYLMMTLLLLASAILYFIPVNYLFMGLGLYKYGRKYLNPDRELNNDIMDFLSRVPDTEALKDWKELTVPEPKYSNLQNSFQRSKSYDSLLL